MHLNLVFIEEEFICVVELSVAFVFFFFFKCPKTVLSFLITVPLADLFLKQMRLYMEMKNYEI